jgi:hypothetical protein
LEKEPEDEDTKNTLEKEPNVFLVLKVAITV